MGKIIQLGEHTWQIPDPEKDDEIFFLKEKKENQYWRRDESYPKIWYDYNPLTAINAEKTRYDDDDNLVALSRTDSDELLRLQTIELKRRRKGVWFMNNGELTYLTGGHYFFLQWGRMPGYINERTGLEYGDYREFQRDTAYFIKMCWEDKKCFGFNIVKPKKTGITQFITVSEILERSTRIPGQRFGMMSVNKQECLRTNFNYFKYAYDGLPYILKPTIAKDNEDKIIFGNPRAKNTGSKASAMRQLENGKGFNSEIFTASTVANAFDGPVMNIADVDEFPKLEDPYPNEVFMRAKETVKIGSKKNGLLMLHAYAPEKDGRSHKEGKKVWDDSSLKTRDNITKETTTGLYRYFISALESGEENFDIYGKPDREKTRREILAKRKQLEKDPKELQAFKRQYPITEQEAWLVGGSSGAPFNNVRLGIRKNDIEQQLSIGDLPYVEGNLRWMGQRLDSPVAFERLTDEDRARGRVGKFRMYGYNYLDPTKFNISYTQRLKDYNGRYKPREDTPYVGGIDPTDYVNKGDVKEPSKQAATVMNFPDVAQNTFHGKRVTNRPICRYLYRPENPNETYEDMLMMIWYFSMYVIIESNKPWLVTKLKEDNMHNFLLVMDKEKGIVPYSDFGENKLTTTTTAGAVDRINELCRTAGIYLAAPQSESDVDNLELIDDHDLLEQLMELDVSNTKKSDLAMAWMWNLLALVSFMAYRQKQQKQESHDDGMGMEMLRRLAS